MSIDNKGQYQFKNAKAKELATLGVRVPKQGMREALQHRIECLKSGIDLIHLHESEFNPAQVERSKRTITDLRAQIADVAAMIDQYCPAMRSKAA